MAGCSLAAKSTYDLAFLRFVLSGSVLLFLLCAQNRVLRDVGPVFVAQWRQRAQTHSFQMASDGLQTRSRLVPIQKNSKLDEQCAAARIACNI